MPKQSNQRHRKAPLARDFLRGYLAGFAMMVATLAPLTVTAADSASQGRPRLARLEIEIWPEYDRPAALVFLKGELAADSGKNISIRLPASSGGPSAVAQSETAGGNLLNLPYEKIDAKDFVTLRIQPSERFFHIEFYDKLTSNKDKREYRYQWPGDLAVDQLVVRVQQPSAANNFSITPAFSENLTGNDTLIYWSKEMGTFPAGRNLPVAIRYSKTDVRTSKELLAAISPAASESSDVAPIVAGTMSGTDWAPQSAADPYSYWIPAGAFALLALAAGILLWRRRASPLSSAAGAVNCARCAAPVRIDDNFCAKCGLAVTGGKAG